ncbi:hypothetical protein B484DRAFT_399328 [Ochromonadaceae sp. CCMP2298]|nr:hypothetical protein B484DRAFT_399328 [Ochromonadaceae sp. CCMP2298]
MLCALISVSLLVSASARVGYKKFPEPVEEQIKSRRPSASDLPSAFDWRNINGTNFGSQVMNQKNPHVCGSCWAQAAIGALSDRYNIATQGLLNIQLSPQNLMDFDSKLTGGSCEGGDSLKAYDFVYKFKVTDDTCTPYLGLDAEHGFEVRDLTKAEDIQAHMCYSCDWEDRCEYLPVADFNSYGVDEFGSVNGEQEMKAEIFARGPIACSLNSEAPAFNVYKGGVISNKNPIYDRSTDHVVVISGWGVDSAGLGYWVGRNSYGGQWGEGAGGGWFRLERGVNALSMESHECHWAVPAQADVQRALGQWRESVAQ